MFIFLYNLGTDALSIFYLLLSIDYCFNAESVYESPIYIRYIPSESISSMRLLLPPCPNHFIFSIVSTLLMRQQLLQPKSQNIVIILSLQSFSSSRSENKKAARLEKCFKASWNFPWRPGRIELIGFPNPSELNFPTGLTIKYLLNFLLSLSAISTGFVKGKIGKNRESLKIIF